MTGRMVRIGRLESSGKDGWKRGIFSSPKLLIFLIFYGIRKPSRRGEPGIINLNSTA